MLSHFRSTDDDDDDCQFVECLNIYGKAMFMIHTRAVSLPDVKKQKTQTEEKTKRWTVVQSLVWKQVSGELPVKSWRRLRFSQSLRKGISELGGRTGQSPKARLEGCLCLWGLRPLLLGSQGGLEGSHCICMLNPVKFWDWLCILYPDLEDQDGLAVHISAQTTQSFCMYRGIGKKNWVTHYKKKKKKEKKKKKKERKSIIYKINNS